MHSFDGPLIALVAAWITILIAYTGCRVASRSQKLQDHPNHRSSHEIVTSKAGGMPIMAGWVAGMFVIGAFAGHHETSRDAAILSGIGLLAFALGLADDRLHLPPLWKLIGQIAVAALFIWAFGPLTVAPVPFVGELQLGFWGVLLSIFWIVAFMNAYNFMDGANGLAAGSTVIGLCGFAIITSFAGASFIAVSAFLLAAASAAFLPANLKRGRLFMGDNGSQALSFLIAAFAILSANGSGAMISALVIPVIFLPLMFDVFWTLISRLKRRRNILEAHREHLYQLMIRNGASHLRVAVTYMTLVAFSTAAAILMLALAPAQQWLAPALLFLLFAIGAFRIHQQAKRDDMLERSDNNEAAVADAQTN